MLKKKNIYSVILNVNNGISVLWTAGKLLIKLNNLKKKVSHREDTFVSCLLVVLTKIIFLVLIRDILLRQLFAQLFVTIPDCDSCLNLAYS